MPYPAIADPVPATVITSAWEIANPLAAVRWLRQLMGNADPPGTSYVVVASSTTTASWAKVPADALAPGAVVSHLTYTPVSQLGDTMTGDLTAPGFQAGAHGVNGGTGGVNGGSGGVNGGTGGFSGGSTAVGTPSVLGLSIGASGLSVVGPSGLVVSGAGGVNVIGGGPIQGGTKGGGGDLLVIGLQVGVHGILSDAQISAPSLVASGPVGMTVGGGGGYNGGSTAVGIPSVRGLNVGDQGIALGGLGAIAGATSITSSRLISTVAPGTAPLAVASQTVVANLNAQMLADQTNTGRFATSVGSSPNAIPVADASGKLDAWITPAVAGATVPSGAIVAFNALASLTAAGAGWTRHTAADGRLLVGDGTTFGQAFAQGGSYGASWGHAHTTPAHQHSGSPMSVSGTTGDASGSGNQANVVTPNPASATQAHTHDLGTLGVAGNTANDGASTAGSTTWLPAMLGVVWGRKL